MFVWLAHFLLPRSVKAREWVTTFLPNKYNLCMSHVNLDVKWSTQSLLKASAALIQSWICFTVEAVVENYCSRCSRSHCCQFPRSLLHFQLNVNQPRFSGKPCLLRHYNNIMLLTCFPTLSKWNVQWIMLNVCSVLFKTDWICQCFIILVVLCIYAVQKLIVQWVAFKGLSLRFILFENNVPPTLNIIR